MMLMRLLMVIFAILIVSSLIAFWFTRQRRWLAWAGFFLKTGVALLVLFGLFFVLERLILR